jgi:hypothetical protein
VARLIEEKIKREAHQILGAKGCTLPQGVTKKEDVAVIIIRHIFSRCKDIKKNRIGAKQ